VAYTKTTWVDGVTPVSAQNMNNLETQYDEAKADLDAHKAEKATDENPPHGMNVLVKGPANAVDESIMVFDGTTGKIAKDGGKKISEILDGLWQLIESIELEEDAVQVNISIPSGTRTIRVLVYGIANTGNFRGLNMRFNNSSSEAYYLDTASASKTALEDIGSLEGNDTAALEPLELVISNIPGRYKSGYAIDVSANYSSVRVRSVGWKNTSEIHTVNLITKVAVDGDAMGPGTKILVWGCK
jgi:hypothetical protein